jgi:hypothetical protein
MAQAQRTQGSQLNTAALEASLQGSQLDPQDKANLLPRLLAADPLLLARLVDKHGQLHDRVRNTLGAGAPQASQEVDDGLFSAIARGAKAPGQMDDNSVARSVEAALNSLEFLGNKNAAAMAWPPTPDSLLDGEISALRDTAQVELIARAAEGSVLKGIRADQLLNLAVNVASDVASALAKSSEGKKPRGGRSDLPRRGRDSTSEAHEEKAAHQVTSTMSPETLVESLGLSLEDAEEVLKIIRDAPEFKKLAGKNPRIDPNSVMAVVVQAAVAERHGHMVDKTRNMREDSSDNSGFPELR